MKALQNFIMNIVSKIDDDIIDRNTETRIDLINKMKRKARKKLIGVISIAASFLLIVGVLFTVLIPILSKQVPVYTGMTVSNEFTGIHTASAKSQLPDYTPMGVSQSGPIPINPHYIANEQGSSTTGSLTDSTADSSTAETTAATTDSLDVIGSPETLYYAMPNADIYITVHIDNPDDYEILSFTLNGIKYSSYMFEEGSDMENLVLKVNVGEVEGTIVEYTIDAIKYIDGTEIKDVKMEGNKNVYIAVGTENLPTIEITDKDISYDTIKFKTTIIDEFGLLSMNEKIFDIIDYENAKKLLDILDKSTVEISLYKGEWKDENLISTKSVSISEVTDIEFTELYPETEYCYVISAKYDAFDGTGFNTYLLAQETFTTEYALKFSSVNVSQTGITYDLVWNEEYPYKEISSITLYRGTEKIEELTTETTEIDGLLSDTEYIVVVEYKYKNDMRSISQSFKTLAKSAPTLNISNISGNITHMSFDISKTDIDNIGTITKIELYKGSTFIKNVDVAASVRIDDLLSNTEYTAVITCEYDLNDGTGVHIIQARASFKTKFDFGIGDWNQSAGLEIQNGCVTGIGSCTDKVLFIEMPIKEQAFSGNYDIEAVYIDSSYVEHRAFYNCESLDLVHIGGNVNRLESSIFGCDIVLEYNIPEIDVYIYDLAKWCNINNNANMSYSGAVFNSAWNLYLNGQKVTELVIPTGTTSVYGFGNCNITSVTIPNSVSSIGTYAFYGCTNLTSVTIPSSVTVIDSYAFRGTGLTSVTIPRSVQTVSSNAFAEIDTLASVTIASGVGKIEENAFIGCAKLSNVIIQGTTTMIDTYAFNDCANGYDASLRIDYAGTKTQWKAQRISLYGVGYRVYCSDGEYTN